MARRLPSTRIFLLLATIFGLGIFMTRNEGLEGYSRDLVELDYPQAPREGLPRTEEGEGSESFGTQIQRVWSRDKADCEGIVGDDLDLRSPFFSTRADLVLLPSTFSRRSNEHHTWRDHNHHTVKALTICIATRSCRPNQDKLLILQDDHYRKAMIGVPAGERIFARSLMKALQKLGYTYLFARDMGEVSAFYTLFPDQIVATIIHRNEYDKCYEDWEHSCLRSKTNPRGIPIQDLFTAQFFGRGAASPFAPWALVPEDIREQNNTYIGYSIEDEECVKQPFVPTEARPRQVWLLGKVSKFFHGPHYPYSKDVWVRASKELKVEFVGAFDYKEGGSYPGVRNLQTKDGPLVAKEEFDMEIARSLAIIGLGDPIISPTPWYGLCYGTPFLNPVKTHLESDGTTRIARSQHLYAGNVGEPHVFNVGSSDLFKHPQIDPEADGILIESLRKAIDVGPRERFIPETMKQEAMTERVKKWLETDWKREMTVNLESETKWGRDARRKQLIV